MSSVCGWKPDHPDETHTSTGRTCKKPQSTLRFKMTIPSIWKGSSQMAFICHRLMQILHLNSDSNLQREGLTHVYEPGRSFRDGERGLELWQEDTQKRGLDMCSSGRGVLAFRKSPDTFSQASHFTKEPNDPRNLQFIAQNDINGG